MQDHPRIPPSPGKPPPRRKKKRQSDLLLFLFFLLFPTVCVGTLGFALYRAGYVPSLFSSGLTATVVAQKNASCQALIEKAMETSNSFCSQIDSNKACYGNNTIKADLAPGTTQTFSTRGDIVDVDKVRRISASPLKLDSNEWGVAILKVIANLPRSLPGQTVTMIVFGNTTLDKEGGNLESFFFSSELGQIVCEKVPDDGIMISVAEGEGVRFTVNGAELTLMGDATIKAVKNGKMEVSLFEGSGRIVSDGQEQYFGAGQQVNVQLGGENGTESVSPPSAPESISQDDLDTICALTGQFCSQDQITPVPSEQAQKLIQEELGITPTQTVAVSLTSPVTLTPTQTPTFTRTPITIVTNTIVLIPSWTPSRAPTKTRIPIVNNPTRRRTPTRTPIPPPPVTPGDPTLTPSQAPADTATFTALPTSTPDLWSDPTCSQVNIPNPLIDSATYLTLDMTNNDPGTISIDALSIDWNVDTSIKITDVFLGGTSPSNQIGNANETTSPVYFPAPNPFSGVAAVRDIDPGITETLYINFQVAPTGSVYTVRVHFNIGCQILGSK